MKLESEKKKKEMQMTYFPFIHFYPLRKEKY